MLVYQRVDVASLSQSQWFLPVPIERFPGKFFGIVHSMLGPKKASASKNRKISVSPPPPIPSIRSREFRDVAQKGQGPQGHQSSVTSMWSGDVTPKIQKLSQGEDDIPSRA